MRYRHSPPFSSQDQRISFAWEVLREALERTKAEFGAYEITESAVPMVSRRELQSMGRDGDRTVTVSLISVSAETDEFAVTPVRIPAMGGLWGYRVFLIPIDLQARFAKIDTIEQLRQISIGQSEYWPDTEILRSAGLHVVTGEVYDGLFKMLENGRFEAFSRSVNEVGAEYRLHKEQFPSLSIEKHVLLHYPMPEYFWFPDDDEGRHLAARAAKGLQSMVDDGSLCKLVESAFRADTLELALSRRRIIEIPNPMLGAADHLNEPRYWCSPVGRKR